MRAYKILTGHNYSDLYCVVAENMSEAERIFNGKYWPVEIQAIELLSEHVQIQKYDEQKKEGRK